MFGPNPTPHYHHRSDAFVETFGKMLESVRRVCSVPDGYDVVCITGSGSLAIEACVWSLKGSAAVTNHQESFGKRIKETLEGHSKYNNAAKKAFHVLYETGSSLLQPLPSIAAERRFPQDQGRGNPHPRPTERKMEFIVDAVSACPYYDAFAFEPLAVITVSGKQLACNAGLAFVFVRRNGWKHFKSATTRSYLNLARYHQEFTLAGQTPNTPAIGLIDEAARWLDRFNVDALRAKIDTRRAMLAEASGSDGIGNGPVFTFDQPTPIQLYSRPHPQAFLWTGSNQQYQTLSELMRLSRNAAEA